MWTRLILLVSVVGFTVTSSGCGLNRQGPGPVAEAFVATFAERELADASEYTTHPEQANTALAAAWDGLQATELTADTGAVRVTGDTATVDYTYTWRLPREREWTYHGQLRMGRADGRWLVRWASANIHPRLGDTQTMVWRTEPAPAARVNEQSGTDVLVPGTVSRVTWRLTEAEEPTVVAAALADSLHQFDDTLTAEAILAGARHTKQGYTVAKLTEYESDQVGTELIGLPGVTLTQEWDLMPTDRQFAPDLVAQVRKSVIAEVDGVAGWSVVALNPYGVETGVLVEVAAAPVPSFSLSVDRRVQNAAQTAVTARTEPAMMVVLQPSTGAVLAIAQNPAADADGPVATMGRYPPGSVFKTVTAAAAMRTGLATPETVLPCPPRIIIGDRIIPNYNLFTIGSVPMATAYARSCNTSFAKLASELPAEALAEAAAAFGIGPEYTVPGLPTYSGSVPESEELVQRTEDGIGQGKVLVSPFGMALLAAAIADGSPPVPYLLAGRDTEVTGERPEISAEVITGLRMMLRKVVTEGTANRIADQGQVYGKTGEAEVQGGSHSWFVGYRGDLAFATLLVKGGSSDNAVAVTRDMLVTLGPKY